MHYRESLTGIVFFNTFSNFIHPSIKDNEYQMYERYSKNMEILID